MMSATTKDRFLNATAELLRMQGYSGTGLKEVTKRASAPWGSMYHFFPGGKEQLAVETIRATGEQYRQAFAKLFEIVPDPIEAISRVFLNEINVLDRSAFKEGCPIAATALDVASTVDAVREACAEVFASWLEEIAAAIARNGADPALAAQLAEFILATLEGAIILARTNHSTLPLRSADVGITLALRAALAR
jgi:AcrR family transcriptional regulator